MFHQKKRCIMTKYGNIITQFIQQTIPQSTITLRRLTKVKTMRFYSTFFIGFLALFILYQNPSPVNADVVNNDTRIAKLTPDQLSTFEKEKQDKIKDFVKKGIALYNQEKFLEAKAQFERAIRLDASQADALDYIKKCDFALENPNKYAEQKVKAAAEKKAQEEAIKQAKAEQLAQEKAAKEAAKKQAEEQ
ncbi:MAG: hypothetical protein ACE14V_15780, partial [bacterium]